MTVAARRNARLRAQALAAIPVLLFILAAIPRVWAPDLVPFDAWEAAQVAAARARSADSWMQAYANPTWPSLALVEPWLRQLPAPVAGWVVLRGLLDALGVALLYLAVRPLVGTLGAMLAGGMYAVSPVAWAAARDPAGSFGPVLGAAALLAAVRLIERPSLLRGALLGLLLALLTRSLPLGLLVVPLGAVTLMSARASWRVGGLTALAFALAETPILLSSFVVVHTFNLPPNVIETRSRLFSSLAPLVAVGAALVAIWLAKVRPGVLFTLVWSFIGVLGGDWVWRASIRTIPSGSVVEDIILNSEALRCALAISMLVTALSVSSIRAVRWWGRIGGLVAVAWLLAGTVVSMRQDASAEWSVPPFTLGGGYSASIQGALPRPTGSLFTSPSLREVTAVTDALREAMARVGTQDVVVLISPLDGVPSRFPATLPIDELQARSASTALILPLERETIYLTSAIDPEFGESWLPIEAHRPSSAVSVFTPSGADTGARIFTLRPRPSTDWLARTRAVPDGRFADGSVLLGVYREARPDGVLNLTLYWQLPAASDGRVLGARAQVLIDGAPPPDRLQVTRPVSRARGRPSGSAAFPAVDARRGGELVVQLIQLETEAAGGRTPSFSVSVYDERDQLVRTASGAADVALPLGH